MSDRPKPASFVAERAVRFLRATSDPVDSRQLALELLATRVSDENDARRLLDAAFDGDARLAHRSGGWVLSEPRAKRAVSEPDRSLVFLEGQRDGKGRPYRLRRVSALRLRGDDVVAACGGDVPHGAGGGDLRRAVVEALSGTVVVVHDPPGALRALEAWTGEVIREPLSLRRLGCARLGLSARHDLTELAGRLDLPWRDSEDPLDYAETVEACLEALRRPGESLLELASSGTKAPPIDWSRFAFDREFLDAIPREPGVYRFFDDDGNLLYVGKSKNLKRRVQSYFRVGVERSPRAQRFLDRLHRIEYERSGSELEAILREAAQIRRDDPEQNVQRRHHPRLDRSRRLGSILILEPAEHPAALRAFLIRGERLLGRVSIGPRGGGLSKIQRILDDNFFFRPDGPTPVPGPDLDVELIVRWLRDNKDRVVAFDPTSLQSAAEVVDRLRWFLANGALHDPDGSPVFTR